MRNPLRYFNSSPEVIRLDQLPATLVDFEQGSGA